MHAWILVSMLLSAQAGEFTEVQEGVDYAAGTRVGMAALGLSFEVPSGWHGGLPQGGEIFVLASDTQPGLVLITGDTGMTVETAQQVFAQPLPLDAATVARPKGTPSVAGTTVTQSYAVATSQGELVGFGMGTVSTGGSGLAVVAFGPEAAAAEALSRRVVGTVEAHASPEPKAPSGRLASALGGRQLLYMKTKNGFSDEEHVYLCSNGQAAIRSESSAVSFGGAGTATYAGSGGNDGTWTLSDQTLTVTTPSSTRSWELSLQADGSVGVNQDNWWVQPQDACP